MRINGYQSTIERVAGAKPVQSTAKSAATESTGDASSILDVKVSAQAKDRAAGLESLKARVQSGNFKVDADAIAAKLVGE